MFDFKRVFEWVYDETQIFKGAEFHFNGFFLPQFSKSCLCSWQWRGPFIGEFWETKLSTSCKPPFLYSPRGWASAYNASWLSKWWGIRGNKAAKEQVIFASGEGGGVRGSNFSCLKKTKAINGPCEVSLLFSSSFHCWEFSIKIRFQAIPQSYHHFLLRFLSFSPLISLQISISNSHQSWYSVFLTWVTVPLVFVFQLFKFSNNYPHSFW